MKIKINILGYCLLLWLLSMFMGCSPYGVVYHHTIRPLSTNMSQTPLATTRIDSRGDIKRFRYNVIDFSAGTNGIGDIARKQGLETIYFAELEKLSILGIWKQEFVRVYGE